jgi:sugar phosphate isomerase/epimerase
MQGKQMFKLATKIRPSRESLEIAAEAGFSSIEFWTNRAVLADSETLAEWTREFAFDFALHFPNRGDLDPQLLENVSQLYSQLGCEAMVIHQPMFKRYADQLLKCNPNLRLGVENHVLSPKQFTDWARKHDWLTLDVEHLWKYTIGDKPLAALIDQLGEFLQRFGSKLVHVHLPGYLPQQEEHRPMYCSREMVMSVWSLLAELDYSGFVVSEVNREYQNVCDLSMDRLLFQRWEQIREEADIQLSSSTN